ncbi:MAG: RNA polymerase sigma factor [Lachnospiraceae bacterium]|nr:RNA polymerase sigma factor [Lachnospiraceae bacterium]
MSTNDPKAEYIGDNNVVERLFQRDESGLRQAEDRYKPQLTLFASRFLSDARDREEAVNDAFLKLWNSIPPARPRSLPAYLLTLQRRAAIDILRRKNRQKEVPAELSASLSELDEILPDRESTEDVVLSRELGRAVSAFLRKLPERERTVFMRRYYGAESVKEIAEAFSVSVSTVEKTLKKTRDGLKEHLEREGFSV